jgi:hypothetical protein
MIVDTASADNKNDSLQSTNMYFEGTAILLSKGNKRRSGARSDISS